tara:strand:+ start:88 stop:417 length:330 start_codon:yes stop_codon:yes gene_type:complete
MRLTDLELEQQEYEQRVLVFKCELDSSQYYGVDHSVIYDTKHFKGTREQFDKHLDKYFKGRGVEPYLIYTKQSEIDNVEHGGADRNILSVGITEGAKRQAEYKYLKSSY